jgi:CBS domain-containing protein
VGLGAESAAAWQRTAVTSTRSSIIVRSELSVTDAKALMTREHVRHLLVTEGDQLVGLVTDRDIRLNLASPATSLSVWEIEPRGIA